MHGIPASLSVITLLDRCCVKNFVCILGFRSLQVLEVSYRVLVCLLVDGDGGRLTVSCTCSVYLPFDDSNCDSC